MSLYLIITNQMTNTTQPNTAIKSQYDLINLRLATISVYTNNGIITKKCGVWERKDGATVYGGYFTNSNNFVPKNKEGVYSSKVRVLNDRNAKMHSLVIC